MKIPMLTLAWILGLLILAGNYACKKSDNSKTKPVSGVVLTNNPTFGSILTDNNGRALYFFYKDAGQSSNCNGGCLVSWPVFSVPNLTVGQGLDAPDFGSITRSDGSVQATFKGWPLYYYASDVNPGDVKGDNVGNLWAVAKPDYTVMVASGQLVGADGKNYNDQGVVATVASQYLTDAHGRTLYLFVNDSANKNKFTKPDFSNNGVWPIDSVPAIGSIPGTFNKTEFSIITVFGRPQLTFRRRPLYYFGPDNSVKGATKGVSVPVAGAGIWKVVNNNTPAL